MNILIVGAGPTGLTTALELARQGITPKIVDAKDKPSELSRAVGILPKSIDILNRVGVGDELIEAGVKVQQVNLYRDGKQLVDLNISAFMDPTEFIIGLPQDETETIMSNKLSRMGVDVQYDTEVVDVRTSKDAATAVFADDREETYDWIIGADGVKSDVRDSLAIAYEGYELPEIWSIADLKLSTDTYEVGTINAWMFEGPGGGRDALVMFPMTENRVRLVSTTEDSVAALPTEPGIQEVLHTGTFQISIRNAKQYRKGRILLAGDAAHAHSPVGGRGMNLGIDDGRAVAAALVDGTPDEYARKRREKAKRVIDGTERARKIILSDNLVVAAGLRAAGWMISNLTFVKRRFANTVTQM